MNRRRRTRSAARPPALEPLEPRVLLSGNAYTFVPMLSFNNDTAIMGSDPDSLVMDGHGNLFGTTAGGGLFGYGTIFEVPAGTAVVHTLANFNGADGFTPTGRLIIDAHDNIFGAASNGGAFGGGTIYFLPAGSSNITVLGSFYPATGFVPFGGLTLGPGGNFYGTTYNNDELAANDGAVYQFNIASRTFTVLHTFHEDDGQNPSGTVAVDSSGNVFGTTFTGGADDEGNVFEITAGSHVFLVLASFDGDNGANPTGSLLVDSAGNLYGITSNGGPDGDGTVFEVPANSGTIVTLAGFDGDNGSQPVGTLIRDAQGNLFGTTAGGGSDSEGIAFVVIAGSGTPATIANFTGEDTGANPSGGLLLAPTGSLYGTTNTGGTWEDGTLFAILPNLPPPAGASPPATTPAAFGSVSAASDSTAIIGWAYDPAAGSASINVAVYIDGRLAKNAPANVDRPDLPGVVFGTTTIQGANHGFDISLAGIPLTYGNHTVSIYALSFAGGVNPLIRTITITNHPPIGVFGGFNGSAGTTIFGWAYDPDAGAAPVQIKIFVDGALLTTQDADVSRADLDGINIAGTIIAGADHGLLYTLPELSSGTHSVSLYAVDGQGGAAILLGTKDLVIADNPPA